MMFFPIFLRSNKGLHPNGLIWKYLMLFVVFMSLVLTMLTLKQLTQNTLLDTDDSARIRLNDLDDNICIIWPERKNYQLRLRPKPDKVPELDPTDYKKLFNMTDFEFKLMNNKTCDNAFLLAVVISAPGNFERRNTLRNTWARNDLKVKTFYMLGATNDAKLQQQIEDEQKSYGDIVQGNFYDSYNNLTLKTVMTLKFITYHCYTTTYILKIDDDIFVNTPLLKNYLTNDLSPYGAENYLFCHVLKNATVIREPTSKWAVTKEEYPNDTYPTYCMGAYSMFSLDVIFKFYKEAQKTKFFFVEDVFLYGMTASKFSEITPTDSHDFSLWDQFDRINLSNGEDNGKNWLFGRLEMAIDEMTEYWNHVLSRPVRSSVYDYSKISTA